MAPPLGVIQLAASQRVAEIRYFAAVHPHWRCDFSAGHPRPATRFPQPGTSYATPGPNPGSRTIALAGAAAWNRYRATEQATLEPAATPRDSLSLKRFALRGC